MVSDVWGVIQTYLAAYGLKVIAAIIIFIVGRIVAGWLTTLARKLMERANWDVTLSKFLGDVTYGILLVIVIILSLGALGVDTSTFVAILGAATLAIGFAL